LKQTQSCWVTSSLSLLFDGWVQKTWPVLIVWSFKFYLLFFFFIDTVGTPICSRKESTISKKNVSRVASALEVFVLPTWMCYKRVLMRPKLTLSIRLATLCAIAQASVAKRMERVNDEGPLSLHSFQGRDRRGRNRVALFRKAWLWLESSVVRTRVGLKLVFCVLMRHFDITHG
jgi:hypothetical protein